MKSDANTYKLADGLADDLREFCSIVKQYEEGKISADDFNVVRSVQGVVPERASDHFMIRGRMPAGIVTPDQLRKIADVSKRLGNGELHLSTREGIQVHGVHISKVADALGELFEVGLSGKNTSGNAVRNITACQCTGICENECFDVSAIAIGLTEFLIDPDLTLKLPRKYKIAVSGCSRDCAGAAVNDLGLIAKQLDGEDGFSVYVGGGMGAKSRIGSLLEHFVRVSDIHLTAEAIKRVLDKYGDRKNKHKARIRHIVETMGMEALKKVYAEELAVVKNEKLNPPEYLGTRESEPKSNVDNANLKLEGSAAERWRARNVSPQKQANYFVVEIPIFLGDIKAEQTIKLAEIIENFGDGTLRITPRQNFQLRFVTKAQLASLYQKLSDIELADTSPKFSRDIVSCIGPRICNRGICCTPRLAHAIKKELDNYKSELGDLPYLKINISGCPNSCGRHAIGDIGFVGAMRKIDGEAIEHYTMQLGGELTEGKAKFAQGKSVIPAQAIPNLLKDFLCAFKQSVVYPDFEKFLHDGGLKLVESLKEKNT